MLATKPVVEKCTIPLDDTYINFDTKLCSGTYYISDSGETGVIIINASNVVVDGEGVTIIGWGGTGLYNAKYENVTVSNIKFSGYSTAAELSGANNSLLNDSLEGAIIVYGGVHVADSYLSEGIMLYGTGDTTIENSVVEGRIYSQGKSNLTIAGNYISPKRYGNGIEVFGRSKGINIIIENNTILVPDYYSDNCKL